jgi:selenocysteine lyase/cysteine desulfurase
MIADMAHARRVDVLVDGAHAFAHFDYRIPDTGADYYAASLHKWLGCPLGTGILYVRQDKIPGLWPIYGDWRMTNDADIMKLNHTGTHPVHTDLTIEHAIAFHNSIGIQRKEARLRYLQTYWTSKVRSLPNVILNTPSDPARACGIANVGIKGIAPADVTKTLLEKYRIWTNAIDSPRSACRASGSRRTCSSNRRNWTSWSRPSPSSPAPEPGEELGVAMKSRHT